MSHTHSEFHIFHIPNFTLDMHRPSVIPTPHHQRISQSSRAQMQYRVLFANDGSAICDEVYAALSSDKLFALTTERIDTGHAEAPTVGPAVSADALVVAISPTFCSFERIAA